MRLHVPSFRIIQFGRNGHFLEAGLASTKDTFSTTTIDMERHLQKAYGLLLAELYARCPRPASVEARRLGPDGEMRINASVVHVLLKTGLSYYELKRAYAKTGV